MDAVEYARPAMRVTEETAALVAELFAQLGQRSWWSGRPAAMGVNSLLRQIGDRGEAGALPLLVPVLLDGRAEVTNAASEVIRELRARLRPHLVPAFDQQCREGGTFRTAEPAWEGLAPADVATLARRPAGAVALQIAMCHRNGFVREAAVRLVATCADGQELPFLLLRSRDWVAPVAAVATEAVRARLTAAHVDDLVAALPIVEAQRQWRRFVADPLLPEIDRLLATPVGRLALVRGLASPDRATRRAAYRHLLGPGPGGTQAANDPSLGELFERALTDADPAIRTWAARLLLDGDDASFRRWAPQLLRARTGGIRAAAARRQHALGQPLPWRDLLLDRHAGVRAVAQAAALDAGEAPDDLYRAHLDAGAAPRQPAALLGLGETGGPDDLTRVRTCLAHPAPPMRSAALTALASLGAEPDERVHAAQAALTDASPGVARLAAGVLRRHPGRVTPADLWTALARAPRPTSQQLVLHVIARIDPWQALLLLLRAGTTIPTLRTDVVTLLSRWSHRRRRFFVAAPPDLTASCRALVPALALAPPLERDLLHALAPRR